MTEEREHLTKRIQDRYIHEMTVAPLGKYGDDIMTPDDWDATFGLTQKGHQKLYSKGFKLSLVKHKAQIVADPEDDALWNTWTITLSHLAKSHTLRQISDTIGPFRLMRTINYLLSEGYIVRKR